MTTRSRQFSGWFLTALIALPLVASSALASDLQRLRHAKHRLTTGAMFVKPVHGMRLRIEAAKLQRLIDAIESGKPIDAAEVERAIRRTYRGF